MRSRVSVSRRCNLDYICLPQRQKRIPWTIIGSRTRSNNPRRYSRKIFRSVSPRLPIYLVFLRFFRCYTHFRTFRKFGQFRFLITYNRSIYMRIIRVYFAYNTQMCHHLLIIEVRYVLRRHDIQSRFGHIINVPIIIVGIPFQLQCKFIMGVALGVIILVRVLTEHKTIGNRSRRQRRTIARHTLIVSFHLDICAKRFIIFPTRLIVIFFPVRIIDFHTVLRLFLRFSLSLHIFIEKQRML